MASSRCLFLVLCAVYLVDEPSRTSALQTGNGACLQIYSVPKQTVVCEPSDEVCQELDDIQLSISNTKQVLDGLNLRVNNLGPSGPTEDLEQLKTTQENHSKAFIELTNEYKNMLNTVNVLQVGTMSF